MKTGIKIGFVGIFGSILFGCTSLSWEETPIITLPQWAIEKGFQVPKGLKLDESSVKITEKEKDGINSLRFVYQGDFEKAEKEAIKIAESAKLIESEFSPRKVKIKSPTFEMNGIIFIQPEDSEYKVWLAVDPDGLLELEVTPQEPKTEEEIKAEEERKKNRPKMNMTNPLEHGSPNRPVGPIRTLIEKKE